MLDWNDLRHFLAVARSGSTLSAAKRMRISQATVSRRIGVLEEALGVELFARSASGYSLTQRGETILPAAEGVERAMEILTALVEAENRRLSGAVRLTTVEGAANAWIIPALASFRQLHPDVRVEILVDDRNLDILKGEADVAIRFGERPREGALICRHLLELEETAYARREMVIELGHPASHADFVRYPLVGYSGGPVNPINQWYDREVPDAEMVHRANTIAGVISAVASGLGAAVMPCIVGDAIPGLVRLFPPIPELSTPCWLVTTASARKQPHVRALIDFVVAQIQATGKTMFEAIGGARAA